MNFLLAATGGILFLLVQGGLRIESAWFPSLVYVYPLLYLLAAASCIAGSPSSSGGFRTAVRFSTLGWIVATLAVYALAFASVRLLLGPMHDWTRHYRAIMEASLPLGGTLFVVAAGASLAFYAIEEFYFRGVLFEAWRKMFGQAGGIALVAAFWALLHLGTYGLQPLNPWLIAGMIPSVFAMGLVLGLARARTGSPWVSFACQSAGNWLLLGLVYWFGGGAPPVP